MNTRRSGPFVAVALVLAVVAGACQFDPSALTAPALAGCGGEPGTHGFGFTEGVDPAGGATYEGTDGDDVIVVVNGPVTVHAGGGNDLICVTDAFPTAAGAQIVIDGGDGFDEIVGSTNAWVVCAGEAVSDCVAPTSGSFAAITYNVAGLPAVFSGSDPETNTPLIAPRLNAFDLVLLQESWLTPDGQDPSTRTYHEILEAGSDLPFLSIPLPAPLGADPRRPTALLSDGLNRFSEFAFEPVAREMWRICGEASADCLSLKGFSMARTTLASGAVVDVYNLHMDAGSADFAVRGDNVDQLVEYILENSAGNAVIVGGDFNLRLSRDPDAAQFADLLARAGLTDVCTELGCAEPDRIDKFLYRSSDDVTITATSWTNADPSFQDPAGEPLSDHDPVVVDFDWSVATLGQGS